MVRLWKVASRGHPWPLEPRSESPAFSNETRRLSDFACHRRQEWVRQSWPHGCGKFIRSPDEQLTTAITLTVDVVAYSLIRI